jgi:hypothetical protein
METPGRTVDYLTLKNGRMEKLVSMKGSSHMRVNSNSMMSNVSRAGGNFFLKMRRPKNDPLNPHQ